MKKLQINEFVLAVLLTTILVLSIVCYKLYNRCYELIDERLSLQQLTTEQHSDNQAMAATILILSDEVQLRQDITSLIVDASRHYNVDPRLIANLIKSESNFRPNIKHSLPQVQCMSGINLKAHPKVLYNPDTITGCIFASAELLSKYIEDSDGLTLALTKYKGFSPLGHTQAKQVIRDTYK